DEDFIYNLLLTVVRNPTRYTGIFRVTNAKTKLIQNVTQSQEIKFGDFMEDIVTQYIGLMGYTNLPKNIKTENDAHYLNVDQLFYKDKVLYLIEQKIRDDHDSTKMRGQYDNFRTKINILRKNYPDKQIKATMWFIDDGLKKNKKYYEGKIASESFPQTEIYIKYGKDLFKDIFAREDVWEEIYNHLLRNKQERSQEVLQLPDFDTSEIVKASIRRLKEEQPNLYKKLISNDPKDSKYITLRSELFPSGID
ncbi:HpyAIV family type II restriction enzyme, partial [Psittacicella hinzii]